MNVLPYPLFDFALRVGLLACLWWIISGGASGSWLIGLPLVVIAGHLSMVLKAQSPQRVHLTALIKFIPFFLYESVRGGIDVAWRVVASQPRLNPAFLVYPLRIPDGPARTFFSYSVSLLPGTLGGGIKDHALQLHVLDKAALTVKELQTLEHKVAAIYGVKVGNGRHRNWGNKP